MTYSHSPRLFVDSRPAAEAPRGARVLPWRKLDADRRFAAIECALKAPANDCADALPIAL